MKILAIGGSPHKGNTYSVLNSIKENYPELDYKLLMLNEVNLEQCRGCYTCVLRGEEHCPLKDERDMIIKEILDADGIVLASPVYVNHATALMKNFMERLGYEAHRPRFYDKYAMVIAVCGMFGAKETNEYMNAIFTSFGFNVVSSLELQIATKSEKEKKYNHKQTMNAFDTFITKIKKGQRNIITMGQMVRFNLFKLISGYNKERFEADYQYYKDKTNIPYDGKINFFKKMLAKLKAMKMLRDFMANR
jgi:multimeric flavodoxin WrbA